MSLSWHRRKSKLATLLGSKGDEDADGIALDRLLHGQNIIGKTSKTVEIDALRFQNRDLNIVGTLEFGQFGVIDVVTCRLNARNYVRKSIEKRFALRTRDQCFPQFERDILLQALKSESTWAPHLLCAFQTPTHLNLVMDYAEGGSLWDVLESSPHNGKLLESDLQWWVPQIIGAVHWCHTQGFAHRDIKPQNFVLKQDAHLLLIDFGSAAPLLPPSPDGSRLLPKRYCLLPCGTCDYISPEILQAHEAALVALEMDEHDELPSHRSSQFEEENGYGVETDWWSFGAMLYEMAYGVTPFFAKEIRHTYQKIMNHERSLRFDDSIPVPSVYKDFVCKLLTHPERRIGRRDIMEITDHPLFEAVNWTNLHEQQAPEGLHLPQFTYNEQPVVQTQPLAASQYEEESLSQGFAFSALFQSSPLAATSSSPGVSMSKQIPAKSTMLEDPSAAFIGFSWGPTRDAFPSDSALDTPSPPPLPHVNIPSTPQLATLDAPTFLSTPVPPSTAINLLTTPRPRYNTFSTPTNNRPYMFTPFRTNTVPRTAPGTIGRSAQKRDLSDREAMKQLADCVGMSARKKVLESGRKPRVLVNPNSVRSASGYGYGRGKELRFVGEPIPMPDYKSFSTSVSSLSGDGTTTAQPLGVNGNTSNPLDITNFPPSQTQTLASNGQGQNQTRVPPTPLTVDHRMENDIGYSGSEAEYTTDSEGPPSPSPRPGSALSTSRSFSRSIRRSVTPTTTSTMTMMMGGPSASLLSVGSGGGSVGVSTPRSTMDFGNVTGNGSGSGEEVGRRRSGSASAMSLGAPVPLSTSLEKLGGEQEQLQVKGEGDEEAEGKKTTGEKRVLGERKMSRERKVSGKRDVGEKKVREDDLPAPVQGRVQPTNRQPRTGASWHNVVFKRRNSDGVTPSAAPSTRADSMRQADVMVGDAVLDDYWTLEKRLKSLLDDIEDVEEKLARLKLAMR